MWVKSNMATKMAMFPLNRFNTVLHRIVILVFINVLFLRLCTLCWLDKCIIGAFCVCVHYHADGIGASCFQHAVHRYALYNYNLVPTYRFWRFAHNGNVT